jgi:quercetin dioxygenase-like cupin family protein
METTALQPSPLPSRRDAAAHVLHVRRGEGEQLWVVGDTYTFKLTARETGGRLLAWEAEIPPEAGPPPHIHHAQLEAYYVLEGELTILDDDRTFTARAGDFVYIPPGAVHAFRNASTRPARMLIWMSPAGLEKFSARWARGQFPAGRRRLSHLRSWSAPLPPRRSTDLRCVCPDADTPLVARPAGRAPPAHRTNLDRSASSAILPTRSRT